MGAPARRTGGRTSSLEYRHRIVRDEAGPICEGLAAHLPTARTAIEFDGLKGSRRRRLDKPTLHLLAHRRAERGRRADAGMGVGSRLRCSDTRWDECVADRPVERTRTQARA